MMIHMALDYPEATKAELEKVFWKYYLTSYEAVAAKCS